jgi:hypothetical protein
MKYCRHVQAFTEVRRDGRLDDRAVGLGHQAAHAGQLADLGGRTAGAGVGHHVDGVERLLVHFLAVAVDDLLPSSWSIMTLPTSSPALPQMSTTLL